MQRRVALAGVFVGTLVSTGCGLLLDFDHLSDGTAGAGGTSSSSMSSSASSSAGGASGAGGAGGAGGMAGADGGPTDGGGNVMVPPVLPPVAVVAGGLNFKIDATEITTAQYFAFTQAFNADPPMQRDVCQWNQSVLPNTAPPNDAGIVEDPNCAGYDLKVEATDHPKAPVRCVDWCDAAAYCTWAGGWMCHGNEGKPYDPEWETACSPTGKTYPYGDTYVAGQCVDAPASKPLDVHEKPLCQGGIPGLFDMAGNVGEWLDCGCEYDNPDPTKTNAYVGGGAYHNQGTELACAPTRTSPLIGFRVDIGVRCCYPP